MRAQGINGDGFYLTAPNTGETGVFLAGPVRAPATITEYVTPGVSMSRLLDYDNGQRLALPDRSLPAGVSAGETVGAGPLVPSTWTSDGDTRGAAAARCTCASTGRSATEPATRLRPRRGDVDQAQQRR